MIGGARLGVNADACVVLGQVIVDYSQSLGLGDEQEKYISTEHEACSRRLVAARPVAVGCDQRKARQGVGA